MPEPSDFIRGTDPRQDYIDRRLEEEALKQLEGNSNLLPLRLNIEFPSTVGKIPFGGFEGKAPAKLFGSVNSPRGFRESAAKFQSDNRAFIDANTDIPGGYGGKYFYKGEYSAYDYYPEPQQKIETETNYHIDPVDNILNQYESYTYKWTFYAARYEVHNGTEDWDNATKIIIAEDGAGARFFINDVAVDTIASLNSKTRIMPHTQFSFRIDEPKGAVFFDHLQNAARNLGLPDHLKVPYYLSLEFYGVDEGGTPVKVDEYSFVWSITILNMKTDVDETGAKYEFEAIATDDVTTTNDVSIVYGTMNVRAKTVNEFFTELEARYNEYHSSLTNFHYLVADKFKFIVDDEIKNLGIRAVNADKDPGAMKSDQKFDEYSFNVPKGYDIGTIVENLMTNCKEWYKELDISGEKNEEKQKFSRVWTIQTTVRYLGYDIFRLDYAKEYIFNIVPKKLERFGRYGRIEEEQHIKRIVNEFTISKVYDYIYTGLNTEVLNFNFHLDYMWYNKIPMNLGANVNMSNSGGYVTSEQITRQQSLYNIETTQNQISTTQDQYKSVKDLKVEDFANPGEEVYAKTVKNRETELTSKLAAQKEAHEQSIDTQTGLTVAQARKLTERLNSNQSAYLEKGVKYIEDLTKKKNVYLSDNIAGEDIINKSLIHSIRISPERVDLAKKYFVEGHDTVTESARSYIANYLNYYMNAEMTSIELEIRGDPFWIGRTKAQRRWEKDVYTAFCPNNDLSSPNEIDYTYRDNLFGLVLKSPKPENADGFYEVESNDLYTGFYQLIRTSHKFSDGKFTQTLEAVKDPLTSKFRTKSKEISTGNVN